MASFSLGALTIVTRPLGLNVADRLFFPASFTRENAISPGFFLVPRLSADRSTL